MLVTSNPAEEKIIGEKVWKRDGYFRDLRPDLNLEKKNMPDNTLYYVNQAFLSTVKNGDLAMYNHNFILGQLIVAANQPADISNYVCEPNKVKLWTCIYDLSNDDFLGVKEKLAFIVLRGDDEEVFFSYGFDSAKEKIIYSTSKEKIPDAFISTSFKKHFAEIMNKKRNIEEQSSLFYYLPSTTDRKESVNKWMGNVNLLPVDFDLNFIESFSPKKEKFQPDLLNSKNPTERNPQVDILYKLFKYMAQHSNQNLFRNADCLNMKEKRNTESMEWSVGSSKKRYDSSKYQLHY